MNQLALKAVLRGDAHKLAEALSVQNDINGKDDEGRTLLMHAAVEGRENIIQTLVDSGAGLDQQDRVGYSALHYASEQQNCAVVAQLVRAGALVDLTDSHGNTPLFKATFSSKGRGETIGELLSSGANPDHINNHGVSPRVLASRIANYDVARHFA